MNAEFEQKLWELKNELETQRLQQVGTMKSVLERQHSKDMIELDDVHQQHMDGLRDGKEMEREQKFISKLRTCYVSVALASYRCRYEQCQSV